MPAGSPGRVLGYANLGSNAFSRGDYELAASHWAHTLPGEVIIDVRLHARRGYVFALVGQTAWALDDAELAFSLLKAGVEWEGGPPIKAADQKLLYPIVIDTLVRTGSAQASDAALRYLARKPEFWGDRMERANVLSQLGRFSEALVELNAAQEDKPDLAVLKNNRCIILRKMQRAEEALPLCEQAASAEPDNLDFLVTVIGAYAEAGRCDKAQEAYATTRKKFPSAEVMQKAPECRS